MIKAIALNNTIDVKPVEQLDTAQPVTTNDNNTDTYKTEPNNNQDLKRKHEDLPAEINGTDSNGQCQVESIRNTNKKFVSKFIYGNYDKYYGYRIGIICHFQDIRLDLFSNYPDLFDNKSLLDIGCNSGLLTINVAKKFKINSIIGIDIDRKLIVKAYKNLQMSKILNENNFLNKIVQFKYGNYVVKDECLLEIEQEMYDTILCLSVTKWIHLNNGDSGIKLLFKRIFKQLRSGGSLVLEAQDWSSYRRRKKLTTEIFENFKSIKLRPSQFKEYLLSSDIGFSRCYQLGTPQHKAKGFRRSIEVFVKA